MKIEMPEKYAETLYAGTCSWKYDSWKGLVYEEGRTYAKGDYLRDYSRIFRTVEIDQWFWSLFPTGAALPNEKDVELYAEAVPDDFRFSVKAPNALTLTHYYKKQPKKYADFADKQNHYFFNTELLLQFLDMLKPFGAKLGPIIFQFEYLNKQKMESLDRFLDLLQSFFESAPTGYRFAIETRNKNYLSPRFFDRLKKLGLGYVYLDGYYMPPIGEVFGKYAVETTDFSIIRLHGPNREAIEKKTAEQWNRIVEPKPAGLSTALDILEFNHGRGIRTFINFNNHYEGSAPQSIARFADLLANRAVG